MHVLMLSDVYFPRVNGVSASIRTFARDLIQRGHEVTLVAPDYGSAHEGEGFELIRLPSRTIFFDPEDRLIKVSALKALLPQLQARRFDVIHIHTPFRAHQLGTRLGRLAGIRTVETYHTYFEQYVSHYLPWLPASTLRSSARWISRRLCHGVDHLIVPSQQMLRVLEGYGIRTPSTVIPTGIHLDEFAGGDGSQFRHRHKIERRRPTLVTVSRLAVEKNITFLLDVAHLLRREFPDLYFIVAGEGPDAPRLKQRVQELGLQENVRFFGNLDRSTELLDCYRSGDVFVFASPTETQGLVLIEAMALGVPIVSTAVMGTATVLEGARCARISAEQVSEFAEHVAVLLRSPEERARLSAAGPADAQAWSAPALMQRVVDLYQRLAHARG
ncbi:MAG: glycosyltransferase [Rhodanobacteraceae bacterium]|nr:glycosyltransferase [Rhodanobacteraceae bacterium]